MKKAGLIDSAKRGVIRISDRGLDVLRRKPPRIDVKFLDQFPEFAGSGTTGARRAVEHYHSGHGRRIRRPDYIRDPRSIVGVSSTAGAVAAAVSAAV